VDVSLSPTASLTAKQADLPPAMATITGMCIFPRLDFVTVKTTMTFTGEYIHHTSRRSPKLEFNSYWHVNNTGHPFDVGEGTDALIAGRVFQQVKTPFLDDSSPGKTFAVSSSDKSTCDSKLGRTCAVNTLTSSGTLSASNGPCYLAGRAASLALTFWILFRQFDGARSWGTVLSSAGPGATPCPTPSGLARKWAWKTIGLKPSPQPSGPPPLPKESHGAGIRDFHFSFF
ncbi:uncharacterized protein N7458_011199, partial [Penicillium daleae]